MIRIYIWKRESHTDIKQEQSTLGSGREVLDVDMEK